jgi:hypothetical protein
MIYVVAEARTNAAKHAQASKVNVFVEGKDGNIRDARTRLICAHARAKWRDPQWARHPHRKVTRMATKISALPARVGQSPEDFQRLGVERGRMARWEDGAHNDGGPGTFEWWYIDAEVDGST